MAKVRKYTIRIKAGERISAEELFCRIENAKRRHPCAEIFVKAPLKTEISKPLTKKEIKNDSKPVPSRREMECQLIFAAIMDSEIYEQNIEFFKAYRFESDFFGKLAKVYAYLWDKGTYDIIALLEEFKQRYGVDMCKLKSALAEGMKSVPSFDFVETCIAELSKYILPRCVPRER